MRRPDDFLSSCAVLRAPRIARLPILLIAALAGLYAQAVAAQTPPTVTLTGTTVTASNVHPGGKVAFFGIGMSTLGFEAAARRSATIVTASDPGGVATLTLSQTMPFKMVWVVVDLYSGQYKLQTPAGFPLITSTRSWTVRTAPNGTVKQLVGPSIHLDAVYVEGANAWTLQVYDNWPVDHAEEDGVIAIQASDFASVTSGVSAPTDFATSGLLVVVDRFDMSVHVQQFGGGQ